MWLQTQKHSICILGDYLNMKYIKKYSPSHANLNLGSSSAIKANIRFSCIIVYIQGIRRWQQREDKS